MTLVIKSEDIFYPVQCSNYTRAKKEAFKRCRSGEGPFYLFRADGRLQIISPSENSKGYTSRHVPKTKWKIFF